MDREQAIEICNKFYQESLGFEEAFNIIAEYALEKGIEVFQPTKIREDYERITSMYPSVDKVMCGRGILRNPGLFGEIKGKNPMDMETLKAFMKEVYHGYKEIMSGDRNVLFKLKELWFYVASNFDEPERIIRKVRKAQSCIEYEAVVNNIFSK